MPIHFNSIRDWLRARVSDSVIGVVLTTALHLLVIAFPGSIQLIKVPDTTASLQEEGADLSQDEQNGSESEGVFSFTSGIALSETERPLPWSNPVFAKDELGPAIAMEKGGQNLLPSRISGRKPPKVVTVVDTIWRLESITTVRMA